MNYIQKRKNTVDHHLHLVWLDSLYMQVLMVVQFKKKEERF